MFRLDVLQTQWLVFALAGGLVLVLCLALFYLAMSRPRPGGAEEAPAGPARPKAGPALPPLLILTYGLVVVFVIVYTLAMARNTPNW